jgi:hypothetical protein
MTVVDAFHTEMAEGKRGSRRRWTGTSAIAAEAEVAAAAAGTGMVVAE